MKRYLLIALFFVLAVAIGIGVGVYLIPKVSGGLSKAFTPGYSAVYLHTGEVYVGRLSMFPQMKLSDPYILQSVPNQQTPSSNDFQLFPLSQSLWSPNVLYLNPSQVVFYGPVTEGSKVWNALQSAGK